jgi:hypothetical protein
MFRFSVILAFACALVLGIPLGVLALTDQHPHPPREEATLAATTPARNTFTQRSSHKQWLAGTLRGVRAHGGSLLVSTPVNQQTLAGVSYDQSWWTSGWVAPKHGFTELNPSWNALTPAGTWLSVRAKVRSTTGATSSWQNFGRWSSDRGFARTSLGAQRDRLSTVSVDTLVANTGVRLSAYRFQVRLFRTHGTTLTPTLRSVHAVASQLASSIPATSRPLLPAKTLAVPTYSQMIHTGEYPQYGGGGEAWCSPTSLAMVLGYYRALPSPADYAWVRRSYPDRFVAEVARRVFDNRYDGTGNWPFNTGYAAPRVQNAVVTRLKNLRAAERFIAKGIPLEASISFGRGQLRGAPISATAGHLVVIVGFTSTGDVVVNDPAAPTDATVRRTYDRAQFEAAWQRVSHGLVYAVRDAAHPWPANL